MPPDIPQPDLVGCVMFLFRCLWVSVGGLVLTALHLPFRLYSFFFVSKPSPPPPQLRVNIIMHEAAASFSSPRDTILFLHGFPDSPALFDPQIAHLTAQGYRCLLAAMPGCNGEDLHRAVTPAESAQMIYDALVRVHDDRVTVLAHDWGCFYAMYLERHHPELMRRIVYLDVGSIEDLSPFVTFVIFSYQLMLAMAFKIGHPGGSFILQKFIAPVYDLRPLDELNVSMCGIYMGAIRTIWFGGGMRENVEEKAIRTRATLGIPHLFMYGKRKAFMFHGKSWVNFVESTPSGKVLEMPCDHWVSARLPDESNRIISQWLHDTESLNSAQQHS